jgi:DNA transposition AAA+ family ATPase
MRALFAHNVANVDLFLAGLSIVKKRGAREASMMLVTGDPGFGKTSTLQWFVTQEPHAIYVRCKAGYTRHWFFRDVLAELGVSPRRLTEDMFRQAAEALASRPYIMVVDEVDHASAQVLEAIRDLADLVEVPVVLVGMDRVKDVIRSRYPQISSRIATVVHFQPISVSDIRNAAATLVEGVQLAEDVVEEIHRQCEGRMRLALNALAVCENLARARRLETVSLADLGELELIHDWKAARKVVRMRRRG